MLAQGWSCTPAATVPPDSQPGTAEQSRHRLAVPCPCPGHISATRSPVDLHRWDSYVSGATITSMDHQVFPPKAHDQLKPEDRRHGPINTYFVRTFVINITLQDVSPFRDPCTNPFPKFFRLGTLSESSC